ncbi:---NA--- [Octopus vulgaris]|uniref:---NA n=1 Tax=Octopus vulgaris TaxID=6645 RepID=A0AA36EXH8_OCTVU|nr:---NA--- [Octopus vulgaris]
MGRLPRCYRCGLRGHKIKNCKSVVEIAREIQEEIMKEQRKRGLAEKEKLAEKERLEETKSRKHKRKKSPTTVEIKRCKSMEEEMQQKIENVEEPITEISEGEVEVQSDEEIEQKSQEAYDKGIQKKGEELQSQECEKIQTIELQWRGELEEQGNRRRRKHGEKHNEMG